MTLVVVGSVLWLRPFPASPTALDAMDGSPEVRVTSSATRITLTPTAAAPRTGLVFQPGARVDPRAYVPLLTRVSAAGVLVVVVKQPLSIGFTAIGAPGDVIDDHPEVEEWSTGGHSLGGVVASAYAEDHPDEVAGLLLWASYPARVPGRPHGPGGGLGVRHERRPGHARGHRGQPGRPARVHDVRRRRGRHARLLR